MHLYGIIDSSAAEPEDAATEAPPRVPARVPRPDSPKRSPLAATIPRPVKRTAGRTVAADTPAYIRAVGVQLGSDAKDYLRRKLGRKLGKFARRIERASVRIEDVNGPRGGVDKRCRIKVVMSGLPSVVVEHSHESLRAAMDGALARVERAVRQAADTRRTKARAAGVRGGRARASPALEE